jgi:hypothetical protein
MKNIESPETIFSALFHRRKTAPRVVVYDDACQLSTYALTRQPQFFANCRFFCDRFHRADHVGCGDGFDIRLFPVYNALNTEAGEQGWSKVNFVVTPAQFMTPIHFMHYVLCFLAGYNADKIATLVPDSSTLAEQLRRFSDPLSVLPPTVRSLLPDPVRCV